MIMAIASPDGPSKQHTHWRSMFLSAPDLGKIAGMVPYLTGCLFICVPWVCPAMLKWMYDVMCIDDVWSFTSDEGADVMLGRAAALVWFRQGRP
jgi:hypothetical protein